jgi:predicted glycoside hydrolase/deacetylase ChbG (UPF0249 family)
MVVAPGFNAEEARLLREIGSDERTLPIGLHLTLTAPFSPLSKGYEPTENGKFLPLGRTALASFLGRLDRVTVSAEIRAQIATFMQAFGRAPDFIDGHQHVHLFPPIADGLLDAVQRDAPNAWVRQCGRAKGAAGGDAKAWVLDFLSRGFRKRAAARGVQTNPAFAGTYNFAPTARFSEFFPKFLDGMPEGGVVMCHPGHVDAGLVKLDPLTTLREREYEFFVSPVFFTMLAARGVSLV